MIIIFETDEEAQKGWKIFKNEGWWYGRDNFKKGWKDYVDRFYEGKENEAPKIYWL